MKKSGVCKDSNAGAEMQMPVGRLFEVISLFKNDRQNILEENPLKRPPTDFITSQDWSIYVKICCHLRQSSDHRQPIREDFRGRSCLIRLVSAFNQLYTEYSLLCDAVEKARDNPGHFLNKEKSGQPRKPRNASREGREKGDESHSLDLTPPAVERLNENFLNKSQSYDHPPIRHGSMNTRLIDHAPTGCCVPVRRKSGQISLNSGDIFDCIQRQPPESSIWVRQLKINTTQTVLTTNYETERDGRIRLEAMRLPIALELTLPRIQRQVQTIMTVCPFINDPLEVIAELRAVNYEADACMEYFNRTKYLGEVIQEFLPTRILRPTLSRPYMKPAVTSRPETVGMMGDSLDAFLVHIQKRLQTIRKLQKDAVRRIQRLQIFSSGLVSVMEQVLMERESQRKSIEKEGALERYRHLTDQVNSLTSENNNLRETLKKEEERRKHLFNMIQEYLGNIRVFCRVRAIPQTGRILEVSGFDTISLNISPVPEEYKFDRAFDVNTTQAEVYAELVPLICSFMDGFNVSFITYGGESSGKTYTLMGGMDGSPESQGVVYRALKTVLHEKSSRRAEWDVSLKVGVVEIYNETLIDLITGETGLHLRVDSGVDRMMDALSTVELQKENQIDELLQICNIKRKVAKTALNEASSRSHLIILVKVRATSNVYQKTVTAVLAMCDLAGFEDIIKADTMGDQVLAKEAGFINRSLTALNRVLTSLKTQSPMSVSYRGSKLTYLLKPFFINSGKCILIVTVRTDRANLPSTQGTLRFGRDSRAVSLGRARRQVSMEKLIQDVGTI